MMALVGGLIALVLGIVGIVVWWCPFLEILMGVIPAILILGGALATYFGFEQMMETKTVEVYDPIKKEFRREIDTLKQELKNLKDKTPSQP
jgi:TRAP-type C4-dicarboxylate transport system permease small subunit